MSKYNFNIATSAKISEKVVREMITKVVEEQTGQKVASIEFSLRKAYGQRDDYEYTVFDGVTVHFLEKQ